MQSIIQYGSAEILVEDPDELQIIRDLIKSIVSEGRTEWVPFMCSSADGTPQTLEVLVTAGVPVTIVTDAPIEARTY